MSYGGGTFERPHKTIFFIPDAALVRKRQISGRK